MKNLLETKSRLFLIIAITVLLLQGTFTSYSVYSHKNKTAYINTKEVYDGFGMKKKLESDLKKTQDARQLMLDSLRFQLDLLSASLQDKQNKNDSTLLRSFSAMREVYFRKQEEFRQANESLARQYSDQVWTQLNQYVGDYGRQNHYEYIFGASGDGTLMYADNAVNITDEVKNYVNNRFKGQP